jgi:hypothetical protein
VRLEYWHKWFVLWAAGILALVLLAFGWFSFARLSYDPAKDKELIQYKTCVESGGQWKMAQEPPGHSSWQWECTR